jgi:hypothetical protein
MGNGQWVMGDGCVGVGKEQDQDQNKPAPEARRDSQPVENLLKNRTSWAS